MMSTLYFLSETFQALEAQVKVKRTFLYHLYSGYMPSSLLVILTWGTFWIPATAVPARVTLIVTNFLTTIFVIQQEGLKIIRVEYTTAVQIFLVVNLFFVLLSMVEYLVVLNVRPRRKKVSQHFYSLCDVSTIESDVYCQPRTKRGF